MQKTKNPFFFFFPSSPIVMSVHLDFFLKTES